MATQVFVFQWMEIEVICSLLFSEGACSKWKVEELKVTFAATDDILLKNLFVFVNILLTPTIAGGPIQNPPESFYFRGMHVCRTLQMYRYSGCC